MRHETLFVSFPAFSGWASEQSSTFLMFCCKKKNPKYPGQMKKYIMILYIWMPFDLSLSNSFSHTYSFLFKKQYFSVGE